MIGDKVGEFQVRLQHTPLSISKDDIMLALAGVDGVSSCDEESPGNFLIKLNDVQHFKTLIEHGCLYVIDKNNNSYTLPMVSNSSYTEELFQPQKIRCPICHIVIETFSQPERDAHVNSCMNSPFPFVVPEEDINDSPFAVVCPYPSCLGKKYEAKDFPRHVLTQHPNPPHTYACPICTLSDGITYTVKQDTNLLDHIQHSHSDFLLLRSSADLPNDNDTDFMRALLESTASCVRTDVSCSNTNPNPSSKSRTKLADVQPSDYSAEIMLVDDASDCSLCLDSYTVGQKIARLPCLCIFHQACLEAWWSKSKKRICTVHSE